jgi:hypothetical protein
LLNLEHIDLMLYEVRRLLLPLLAFSRSLAKSFSTSMCALKALGDKSIMVLSGTPYS